MKPSPAKMMLTAVLVAAVVLGSTKAEEEGDHRMGRVFAYYSTTQQTRLTTTTITGLETCLTTAEAADPICQGRRKRMASRETTLLEDDVQTQEMELDGSLDENFEAHKLDKREVPVRTGKQIVIWSTNFKVITITTTSTLPLTTVTIKALCKFPGSVQACI